MGAVGKTICHLASLRAGARFSNPGRVENSELEMAKVIAYGASQVKKELLSGIHGASAKQGAMRPVHSVG